MRNHLTTVCVITSTLALAACTEGTGSRGIAPVSLALSSAVSAAAPAAAQAGGSETFTDSTNKLVISSVEGVLRKVELKRAEAGAAAGCAMGTSGITASDDGGCGEDNDEIAAGPALVDLPLGGIERTFTANLPAGSFDALEFQIHKVSADGDAADQAFLKAHPDFAGISMRVKGTFNGAAFTYTSDFDVEQELKFEQPVVVEAGKPASVTAAPMTENTASSGDSTSMSRPIRYIARCDAIRFEPSASARSHARSGSRRSTRRSDCTCPLRSRSAA